MLVAAKEIASIPIRLIKNQQQLSHIIIIYKNNYVREQKLSV
jgi:hypothetical protein